MTFEYPKEFYLSVKELPDLPTLWIRDDELERLRGGDELEQPVIDSEKNLSVTYFINHASFPEHTLVVVCNGIEVFKGDLEEAHLEELTERGKDIADGFLDGFDEIDDDISRMTAIQMSYFNRTGKVMSDESLRKELDLEKDLDEQRRKLDD
jgi:hypothetical protein